MLRCGNCGRDNAEDMRFCTNCGALLEAASGGGSGEIDSSQSPETISFSVPPPTSPTAGWPTVGSYLPPQPPVSKGRSNNTGLVISIVVVAVLGVLATAGGIGWYLFSKSDTTEIANRNAKTENVSPSPSNTNANTRPSPEASPTPSNTSFEPPTVPTKEGSFTVYANEGWQLSKIAVVPYEKYTTKVEGLVDLAGAKAGIRAGGDKDAKLKSRRLFGEYPTGALLMRTRYADGRFSNTVAAGVNGAWANLPDERGMLEFAINDNAPKDNGGQFTVRVKMTSVPKNK